MAVRSRPIHRGPAVGADREKIELTVLSGAFVLIAGWMWYLGAYYTLAAVEAIWPQAFANWGAARWLVPAIISVIEVLAVDHAKSNRTSGVVLVVLGILGLLDLGSTIYGVRLEIGGKFFQVLDGFTVPSEGAGLLLISLVIGAVLTFTPERLILWAARTMHEVWR